MMEIPLIVPEKSACADTLKLVDKLQWLTNVQCSQKLESLEIQA